MRDRNLTAAALTSGLILFGTGHPAVARQTLESTRPASNSGYQSGYDAIPEFGGPSGVSQQIKDNDEERPATYRFDTLQRWLAPYFGWKQQMQERHGFSLGINAWLLYQNASETASGDDDGAGGIYRIQGSWSLFGRGTGHAGRLEWRIENRSEIGGGLSPSQLGGQIAAALNSGFGYSDNFDTDISVFNWTQNFAENRAGLAIGRLAFDAYLDAFPFQTFSRGFLNRAFLVNPTLGTTGIGALGIVGKGFVSDQFWIGGHIYDGNAASGDFDWDTFEQHEWLSAVEIGWTPSIGRYKTDRVQFTYWSKDRRVEANVPKGSGWALSASYQVNDDFLPFFRMGHSDGGAGVAAENAASLGFEYNPRMDQAWTLGVGWAEPSRKTFGKGLDDEWAFETSYKFQMSKNFSFTPDLQLVLNPARVPEKSSVWILGLRGILMM